MTAEGRLVLCPVDFSPRSRAALLCAVEVAGRFDARLMLLTVDEGLRADADAAARADELRRFLGDALGPATASRRPPEFEVAAGAPADEILRVARASACDVIVMGTHARPGAFGATAERVLGETTVPVLIVPTRGTGPASIEEASRSGAPVLVPVDFGSATAHQVDVARRLASALNLPLLFLHVIEALHVPAPAVDDPATLLARRMAEAQASLDGLRHETPPLIRCDTLIEAGHAPEEIARVAREQPASLMVMGLHGSPAPGPRMGSVTHAVLSRTPILTLALPPRPARAARA